MKHSINGLMILIALMMCSHAMAQNMSIDGIVQPGKTIHMLRSAPAYELYMVGNPPKPDSSMGPMHGSLLIKPPKEPVRQIANDVYQTRPGAMDNTYFLNLENDLFVTNTKGEVRKIADRVYGNFSFNREFSRILVVRAQTEEYDLEASIEMLDSKGTLIRRLVDIGKHSSPIFTPDEKKVLYISSDSGIYSWYLVNVDGSQNHQLTNVGMECGAMTDDFVPVMSTAEGSRFIDNTHFRYFDGDEYWVLDISTGKAKKEIALKQ